MHTTGLYERTHILVGDRGIEQLRQAHILLAGLGGVGSYAAEALARAGIGRLTLIDNDVVSPSNINRQLPATEATIGQKKVTIMGARLASINPHCHLTLLDHFLVPATIPTILAQADPNWVVDAIDSLNCKVSLLVETMERGVPVVSSMGAGGRLDPTRLMVSDLMDTSICPLARKIRNRLRRRGCGRGIITVWSPEPPAAPAPPESLEHGRVRVVNGTISYLPALFGMTLAGIIIQSLLK